MRRRLGIILTLLATVVLGLLGPGVGPASAGPPETGGLVDYNPTFGSEGHCCTLANDNLYIINFASGTWPMSTATGNWDLRTDAVVLYRNGNDPNSYDCYPVHCAYVRTANLGANNWRVRVTSSRLDEFGRYYSLTVYVNTYYARDATIAYSEACQAVGKGLGLDYTRSVTDYRSCISSAMRYTVGNSLDDGYVAQLW